jgi:hypothetical protein
MSKQVEWAEQWGEWIIVVDDIGYRYYFDCKAEAQEYVRLTENLDHEGYVWRRLGLWSMKHKHNYECRPHWQRGTNEHNN